jgi:cytochrome c
MKHLLAVAAASLCLTTSALAEGDAIAGKAVFRKCMACHSTEPVNKVGPTLSGIIGRPPKAMVPGTRMTFAGLKKIEDIANLIAYLKNPAEE